MGGRRNYETQRWTPIKDDERFSRPFTPPEQLVNIDSGLASHWGCWWTSKHLVSLQGELILLLCMGGCWRVDAKPGLWTEIHIYWLWPMCIHWKFNGLVWSTVNQLYRACKWCQKSYITSINSLREESANQHEEMEPAALTLHIL